MPTISTPSGLNGPAGSGTVWGPTSALPTTGTWAANLLSFTTINIQQACTLTGLQIPNGGTAAGNVFTAIYNAAGTTRLAVSASTAMAGTFVHQLVPFTGTLNVTPAAYVIAVLTDSATATFVQFNGYNPGGSAAQGGFAVPATITPPTVTQRAYTIAAATY